MPAARGPRLVIGGILLAAAGAGVFLFVSSNKNKQAADGVSPAGAVTAAPGTTRGANNAAIIE